MTVDVLGQHDFQVASLRRLGVGVGPATCGTSTSSPGSGEPGQNDVLPPQPLGRHHGRSVPPSPLFLLACTHSPGREIASQAKVEAASVGGPHNRARNPSLCSCPPFLMESLTYAIRAEGGGMNEEDFSRLLESIGRSVPTSDGAAPTVAVAVAAPRRPRRIELRGNCMRYTLHDASDVVLSLEQASRLLATLLSREGLEEVTIWGGRDWSNGNDGLVRGLVHSLAIKDPIRTWGALSSPSPSHCCLRELWLLHPSHKDPTHYIPADVASEVVTRLVDVLERKCLPFVEVLVLDGWMASHQTCQDAMAAACQSLPRLETLRMCGNRIRHLDHDAIHSIGQSASLRTLILSGNPLGCGGPAGPKSLARLMMGSCRGTLQTLVVQDCGIGTTAMSDHLVIALSSCQLLQLQLEGNPMGGELLGAKLVAAMRGNPTTAVGINPSAFGRNHAHTIRDLQNRNRLFRELGQRFGAESGGRGTDEETAASSCSTSSNDRSLIATTANKEWALDYLPLLSADNDTVRSTSLYWVLRSVPDRLRGVAASLADHRQQQPASSSMSTSSRCVEINDNYDDGTVVASSPTAPSSSSAPRLPLLRSDALRRRAHGTARPRTREVRFTGFPFPSSSSLGKSEVHEATTDPEAVDAASTTRAADAGRRSVATDAPAAPTALRCAATLLRAGLRRRSRRRRHRGRIGGRGNEGGQVDPTRGTAAGTSSH